MLSYRLGMVNDFHWGFKPVLSYSKPHTFSTSLGEEKERKNAFNLSNQATWNVNKRTGKKKKWVKERERENSKYKRLLPVKIITGPWQSGQC